MKMWKKAASVMLSSAMVVSLAACGSSGNKSGGSSDSDTFKIGGIGPTTGDAAIYGTAVKNGIQLAVDEINAAGGINGKQIEYKFEDDQADSVRLRDKADAREVADSMEENISMRKWVCVEADKARVVSFDDKLLYVMADSEANCL